MKNIKLITLCSWLIATMLSVNSKAYSQSPGTWKENNEGLPAYNYTGPFDFK
jgi:hypothetical protein